MALNHILLPTASLMADVDMSDFLWLPMGTKDIGHTYEHGDPTPYAGNFDGNVITGGNYGLFGETKATTVQNAFVVDCDFRTLVQANFGCIIGNMTGGTLAYSEGADHLESSALNSIFGGLVGKAANATIHSSMAMAEMTGTTMGGLVGEANASSTEAFTRLFFLQ